MFSCVYCEIAKNTFLEEREILSAKEKNKKHSLVNVFNAKYTPNPNLYFVRNEKHNRLKKKNKSNRNYNHKIMFKGTLMQI